MKQSKTIRALSQRNKLIALGAMLVVVAVGVVVVSISASGFFTASEPESGTLATNAKVIDDTSASGGKAVQFTAAPVTPPPPPPPTTPGARSCPPYPAFPDGNCTGVPPGVTLHTCSGNITASGTYDSCQFNGDITVRASNVIITRSLIKGSVEAFSGFAGQQSGLVISDSTIDCGCQSNGSNGTPSAIQESNYTLTRVNLFNSGHGAAVKSNVVIEDSWIHGLGGNTEDHKDGIFSGDGNGVTVRHNTIECNDGPVAGCTSAIGLLTDFADIYNYNIVNNLLNTNGSYCFYGSGGPQKHFVSHDITFSGNHFGRKYYNNCGFYGPVTYFDTSQPHMKWENNVWDDTGAVVQPSY